MSWWDTATDLALTFLTETVIPAPGLDPVAVVATATVELVNASIDAGELVLGAVYVTGAEDATERAKVLTEQLSRESAKREVKARFEGVEVGILLERSRPR